MGWASALIRKKEGAFLGCGKATCALQKHALDTSVLRHIFSLLISSHLVWSHLMSTHLISSNLISSHLIFSYLISCSSQLMPALLSWPQLFSSLLMPSELFSSLLSFPLFAARLKSALSSSPILSCQVVSTHLVSGPKPAPKPGFWSHLKGIFKGKWQAPKTRKKQQKTHCHNLCASSRETSLKTSKWKRCFRARLSLKSGSWSCENEAFVRDILQELFQLKLWKRRSLVGDFPFILTIEFPLEQCSKPCWLITGLYHVIPSNVVDSGKSVRNQPALM